jgi:hypothetical protein
VTGVSQSRGRAQSVQKSGAIHERHAEVQDDRVRVLALGEAKTVLGRVRAKNLARAL